MPSNKAALPCLLAAALLTAGCISSGNVRAADERAVAQVHRGMSQEEVRALLGEPTAVSRTNTSDDFWFYTYAEARPNAAAFVPVVSLFAGRVNTTSASVSVWFDAAGRVKSVTTAYAQSGKR